MQKYDFSQIWFERQRKIIEKKLPISQDEFHILEIGCYEGRGTVFYTDLYLEHKNSRIDCIDPFFEEDKTTPIFEGTEERFLYNISQCKYPEKVKLYKNFSIDILPSFVAEKRKYDYISIDGSHIPKDVLFDAVMAFELIKSGGIIFFDDYGADDPGTAIDSFLLCYEPYLEVIHKDYHLMVRKR